jgi:radical SAM superfamily enzyme YgiQ (UPF0313 family)
VKVTFIYPAIALSGFNDPPKDMSMRNIHHGLCYLSACAKRAGFATELIDLSILSGWDDLRDKLRKEPVEIAAVSIMSPDYPYAVRAARIIKECCPSAVVIAGGIHPTIAPDELSANPDFDYIVRCEGEEAFVSLLQKLSAGARAERVITGRSVPMDSLPFIDRHLFNCLEYPWDFFLPMPFFTIMAGRGCSYNCKFCAPATKTVHGKGSRRRSVANFLAELKSLQDEYGMRSFMLNDDCFTEEKKWVAEFCDAYKAAGFRQKFICQTRADIICKNPDMIRRLAKIGLKLVMIGFESGNDRVLKFINKGVTLKQNLEAARICRANGIRIFANYMLGLPTETKEEAMDTIRMIKKIRPYRASAAFFTPMPGSYLYDYCKDNGMILIGDHDNAVRLPEDDKPKIKGADYEYLKRCVRETRKPTLETRFIARLDRIFSNRTNRHFIKLFRRVEREHPEMHRVDILRLIHKEKIHA